MSDLCHQEPKCLTQNVKVVARASKMDVDSGQKGQVRSPAFDDRAQPAAGAHEHPVEMLRGKSELVAQLLLVGSV